MEKSFYFYDLETSDLDPRTSRIMQFAGQRTDLNLEPLGEPDDILVKITPDVLPSPSAILITGITPQKTLLDGITEKEFLDYFHQTIATPGTIFVGFNSIRFDDEFIRFTNYRNFYDPYEWQWLDGRSKWDILDLVRMSRALRPEGIKWPVGPDGKPSNRLELLTSINKLLHEKAHDALSDVQATIAIAKLIHDKQPKLFEFLLSIRDKKAAEKIIRSGTSFIYTAGSLSSKHEKTTIAHTLFDHPNRPGNIIVYDLTIDPIPFLRLKAKDLAEKMKYRVLKDGEERFPTYQIQLNKCPAVAPLSVMREEDSKRLSLDPKKCEKNLKILEKEKGFLIELAEAFSLNEKPFQTSLEVSYQEVDGMLYQGFVGDHDKQLMKDLRNRNASTIVDFHPEFNDDRLNKLILLYKARQFPKSLSHEEQAIWNEYINQRLVRGNEKSRLTQYAQQIEDASKVSGLTKNQQYLLEELSLYAQSVVPYDL